MVLWHIMYGRKRTVVLAGTNHGSKGQFRLLVGTFALLQGVTNRVTTGELSYDGGSDRVLSLQQGAVKGVSQDCGMHMRVHGVQSIPLAC